MHAGNPRLLALAVAVAVVVFGLPAVTGALSGPNLVVNPSFEEGTTGWYVSDGASLQVTSGQTGQGVLIGSGDRTRTVVLNDEKNTVSDTRAGTTYVASAHVQGDGGGVPSAIRIQEWARDGKKGEGQTYKWLPGKDWERIEVRYTAKTDGASLDLNIVGTGMAAGRALRVDDVRLVADNTAPAPDPAPAPAPDPATPESGDGWRLVWADEFDGTSLDRGRWNVENHSTYGDGNQELACLMDRPENLTVSGGTLTITARRETTPVACGTNDSRFPGGRSYTSAHLTTKNKAAFTYGRIEMRAQLPTGAGTSKGLWPAFWMRPTSGGAGEIDIMEAIGSGAGDTEHTKVHQTLHYDYVGTHPRQANTYTFGSGGPSDGMHTYAVEWEPGEIRWYIDDQLTYARTGTDTPWLSQAFDQEFFMRLNMAVGGTWPGSPDAATRFPAAFRVDYIRVYQR